jgi:hypothetical protein
MQGSSGRRGLPAALSAPSHRVDHTTLVRIVPISVSENARSVCVRTLPALPVVNASVMAVARDRIAQEQIQTDLVGLTTPTGI